MMIREMTAADYDAVWALWMSCKNMGLNDLDDSREGIEKYLKRNPNTCFVALEGGALAGVILSGHDGRRGFIHHMAVAEAYRHRGIGTALVDAALSALRTEGIHKVALVGGEDAYFHHFTRLGAAGKHHPAVDVRGIECAAAPGRSVLLMAHYQHVQLPTDQGGCKLVHDLRLDIHAQLRAPLCLLAGTSVRHPFGPGAFLGGVGENSRPLDPGLPQECAELLKFRLALAGKPGDQTRAEHQPGDPLPELFEQSADLASRTAAVHPL